MIAFIAISLRKAWLSKVCFQNFSLFFILKYFLLLFFLVNVRLILMCLLIFSLLFLFLFSAFETDNCDLSPGKQKSCKSHYFKKSFKDVFIFFLEIKSIFSALIIWDYGQVVLSSGMWTKQKQPLERESSKFMAVSTCSVCQYLWCHNQIKTIPSVIYISTVPRLHRVMPKFLSRFKARRLFRTLRDQSVCFYIHFIHLCEGKWIIFTCIRFAVIPK